MEVSSGRSGGAGEAANAGELCARRPRPIPRPIPRPTSTRSATAACACGRHEGVCLGQGPVSTVLPRHTVLSCPLSCHSPRTGRRLRRCAARGPPPGGRPRRDLRGGARTSRELRMCAGPAVWSAPRPQSRAQRGASQVRASESPACSCLRGAPSTWGPCLLPRRFCGVQPCSPSFPRELTVSFQPRPSTHA